MVSAGTDQSILVSAKANLDGTVTDDGLPSGTLTTAWTKVSGPGTVTFGSAAAVDTTAAFSAAGTYVLQLQANDGALSATDTMTVVVGTVAPTNRAPVVSAGADQSILVSSKANLDGTVSDDGLPNGTLTTAWSKVSGPGTVTFGSAAAVDTTAAFSAAGTYVLRLAANDGQLSTADDMQVTVASQPQSQGSGIWITREELMRLPTSGSTWSALVSAANSSTSSPNVSNQDDNTDVNTLAKAMVGVRTGNQQMISDVRATIMKAIGTEAGGRTLALGRNLAPYVIAADIVGLDSTQDTQFRAWLRKTLSETLDGKTLQNTHEDRPNNWGTMAGGSRAAVAVYLGDQAELARTAQVFKGYLGDRASYAGFDYGDLSWQADPSKPVGINPKGAMKDGHSIDGAIPDDMRRGGTFHWPPSSTGYPWEALQGVMVQAEILGRAGYDTWQWQDQAVLRAVKFLYDIGWKPSGDDQWQPFLIDAHYGTNYASNPSASGGKIMGWTAWTSQLGLSSTPTQTSVAMVADLSALGTYADSISTASVTSTTSSGVQAETDSLLKTLAMEDSSAAALADAAIESYEPQATLIDGLDGISMPLSDQDALPSKEDLAVSLSQVDDQLLTDLASF